MVRYEISPELPSAQDFRRLRHDTDWGEINQIEAQASLSASLCGISLSKADDKSLIGMARVIGDGVLNLYIQDVIIAKNTAA